MYPNTSVIQINENDLISLYERQNLSDWKTNTK